MPVIKTTVANTPNKANRRQTEGIIVEIFSLQSA